MLQIVNEVWRGDHFFEAAMVLKEHVDWISDHLIKTIISYFSITVEMVVVFFICITAPFLVVYR